MLGGLLFSVMDTTIVSTALVTLATDLDDFQNMYWVVLAYLLSYLGELPLVLSDLIRRRASVSLTVASQVLRSASPNWQITSAVFQFFSSPG